MVSLYRGRRKTANKSSSSKAVLLLTLSPKSSRPGVTPWTMLLPLPLKLEPHEKRRPPTRNARMQSYVSARTRTRTPGLVQHLHVSTRTQHRIDTHSYLHPGLVQHRIDTHSYTGIRTASCFTVYKVAQTLDTIKRSAYRNFL